jgi:hypothetical protein
MLSANSTLGLAQLTFQERAPDEDRILAVGSLKSGRR